MILQNQEKKRFAMLPVIFSLALPTMLEQLMQTAVQYIDIAMVGSLGTAATAVHTVSWHGTCKCLGLHDCPQHALICTFCGLL